MKTNRKIISIASGLALTWSGAYLAAAQGYIAVPSSAGDTENIFPFCVLGSPGVTMRYQQVYNATAFSGVSQGVLITGLSFHIAGIGSGTGSYLGDIQIDLSTALKSENGLSNTFSDNVGNDDTIVDQVRLKLAGDPLVKGGAIQVDANHGVVTLAGAVNTSKQKVRAGQVTRKVKGVKQVVNNLVVKSR